MKIGDRVRLRADAHHFGYPAEISSALGVIGDIRMKDDTMLISVLYKELHVYAPDVDARLFEVVLDTLQ